MALPGPEFPRELEWSRRTDAARSKAAEPPGDRPLQQRQNLGDGLGRGCRVARRSAGADQKADVADDAIADGAESGLGEQIIFP